MKWLFVLLLALVIFGGAAWFGYNTFVKEDIAVKKEQRGEVTPPPAVDISLPEFQAAAQLRQDRKLTEARDAFISLIQKYPSGKHLDEARDLLGEVNVDILLSRYPSPEKTEYVVKPGDVLAKISRKLKTTPELIMRMNNMSGTMLHIGEHLLISHPDFSIVIQNYRANNQLKSRQKLPKQWLGRAENASASVARSTLVAPGGSDSRALQVTPCIRCRIRRIRISINRPHRRASAWRPPMLRS